MPHSNYHATRAFGILRQAHAPSHGTVTLFGALHFGSDDMYPLPDRLEHARQTADAFAFETDLEALATFDFNDAMRRRGRLPDGQRLHHSLLPQTWQQLAAEATRLGFPPDLLDACRAWYAASLLTSAALRLTGLNSQLGIDTVIFRQAAAQKRPIICLETPEHQLELLADINRQPDEDFIRQTLAELRDMPTFTATMLDLWLHQQDDKLAALIADGFAGNSPLQAQMLDERNHRWFETLDHASADHRSVLAVVGAGHLIGPGSLMHLFSQAGYRISS